MHRTACLLVLLCTAFTTPWSAAQGGAEGGPYFLQRAYVKASNSGEGDAFGNAVAAWEHTLVVGADHEDSIGTGIDGEQHVDNALDSGAVYVFENTPAGLGQQVYLKAHNSNFMDRFGTVLALHEDTLVVGAPREDSSATGVNGNGLDNSAGDAGAAYVFVRDGDTWTQQAYLKASNTDADDRFGSAVAIWGDTLAVGAPREDSSAVGVDGEQDDEGAAQSGAVYVFVRVGDTWTQAAYLKASNTDAGDSFGGALALHQDTLVVGAQGEAGGDTGVGADPSDNSVSSAGAAYVFVRDGASWSQQAYLKPQSIDAYDSFGAAVALWEDTLLVGMPGDDALNAANPASNSLKGSGAACVFVRDGTTWTQQAFLKSSQAATDAQFGASVALNGQRLVVGAPFASNPFMWGGLAQFWERTGSTWIFQNTISPSTKDPADRFGHSVALSAFGLLVGAIGEDSGATVVNGNQAGNATSGAGAAWYFVDPLTEHWFDEGCEHPGASGPPRLVGSGPREPDSDNAVRLSLAAPSATCALFVAASSTPVAFKGGTLKPFPFLAPKFLTTSPNGNYYLPFVMPGSAPSGLELWVQWAVVDAGASHGVALSNAVLGVVP